MKITESLIEAAYRIAKQHYDSRGKIGISESVSRLTKFGLKTSTSADMIYNLKHLLEGRQYERNLSVLATQIYFRNIERDYAIDGLRMAVSSLQKHIIYYQNLSGTPMRGQAAILHTYRNKSLDEAPSFISPEEAAASQAIKEGHLTSVMVNRYERSTKARKLCIEHYGLSCAVCNFDFAETYGEIGVGFIHVHHLIDLTSIGEEYEVDPIRDLRPVCPNCHSMLHRTRPASGIEELKKRIRRSK